MSHLFIWPEANTDFVAGVVPPEDIETAWYFVFDGRDIVLTTDADGQYRPLDHDDFAALSATEHTSHYLGALAGHHCFAVETAGIDGERSGLRGLFGRSDNLMFSLAGRAAQVIDWYRTHRYCGRCGGENEAHPGERAMVCHDCGIHAYPRLSPSIIVLIHKDRQVLLARNHRWPEGLYSTLAGFVEPGEAIEETLKREVKEEVGVDVGNLEYLGSQPWPFPNSLMLGFLAEYEQGEIVCQEDEIADAAWFDIEAMPKLPGNVAISRWLIDSYLTRMGVPV